MFFCSFGKKHCLLLVSENKPLGFQDRRQRMKMKEEGQDVKVGGTLEAAVGFLCWEGRAE